MQDLLATLDQRGRVMELVGSNPEYCGTVLDGDGYPILCAGTYECANGGVSWTFFHDEMRRDMRACVRIVKQYAQKFMALTDKPIYVTVDNSHPDAVRWVKLIGFRQKKGGIWWVHPQR